MSDAMKAMALENAEWEAAYPRSALHMQGARKNARNRYRAFFDDSGKLTPGVAESVRHNAGSGMFGTKHTFVIGPDYCSSQERQVEEVVVARLRRRARPRTQAVRDEAGIVVKWVRPTPAHSAYPRPSEARPAEDDDREWSLLPILTPVAQALRQIASSYSGGDGSGASRRDEQQLDLLMTMVALRSTCKTALLAGGDGRLVTRALRKQALSLRSKRWNRRMVHVEALGVEIMAACTELFDELGRLMCKFESTFFNEKLGSVQAVEWSRAIRHVDCGVACYEQDVYFKEYVEEAMASGGNVTGIDMHTRHVESGQHWDSGLKTPVGERGRRRLADTRQMVQQAIERNTYLLDQCQNHPHLCQYFAKYSGKGPHSRAEQVVDGCLFVIEGHAEDVGTAASAILKEWKRDVTERRLERDAKTRDLEWHIERARQHDRNLSVFLKTSNSERFADEDVNECAPFKSSGGRWRAPGCWSDSDRLTEEFMSLCDAKAGLYFEAHPDAHKSRWPGSYAKPDHCKSANLDGQNARIKRFGALLAERNASMKQSFKLFCALRADAARIRFYDDYALELERAAEALCKRVNWYREERCAAWCRQYWWRRARIDTAA